MWNTTKLAGTKLIANITQIACNKLLPTCLLRMNVTLDDTNWFNLQKLFIKLFLRVVHWVVNKFNPIFVWIIVVPGVVPVKIKIIFF